MRRKTLKVRDFSEPSFLIACPSELRNRLVKEGDRIAQLIVEKIETPDLTEVDVSFPSSPSFSGLIYLKLQDLDATLRGMGGFGSTGGHSTL